MRVEVGVEDDDSVGSLKIRQYRLRSTQLRYTYEKIDTNSSGASGQQEDEDFGVGLVVFVHGLLAL